MEIASPSVSHRARAPARSGGDLQEREQRRPRQPRMQALAGKASSAGYRDCGSGIDLGTPGDPLSNCEWWLADSYTDAGAVHYGTDAAGVWSRTRGAGVTVAVVDTGVEPDHPDLLPNLLNAQGYNFWNHTVSGSDGYGHGTLVAGIVAAAAGERRLRRRRPAGEGPADQDHGPERRFLRAGGGGRDDVRDPLARPGAQSLLGRLPRADQRDAGGARGSGAGATSWSCSPPATTAPTSTGARTAAPRARTAPAIRPRSPSRT